MLTLTDTAREIVREMVDSEGGAPGSGLRIAPDPGAEGNLALSVTDAPADGDVVVDEGGTRVFLEPEAAAALDDKVLDAHRHGDHAHFSIAEQGGGAAG